MEIQIYSKMFGSPYSPLGGASLDECAKTHRNAAGDIFEVSLLIDSSLFFFLFIDFRDVFADFLEWIHQV